MKNTKTLSKDVQKVDTLLVARQPKKEEKETVQKISKLLNQAAEELLKLHED